MKYINMKILGKLASILGSCKSKLIISLSLYSTAMLNAVLLNIDMNFIKYYYRNFIKN